MRSVPGSLVRFTFALVLATAACVTTDGTSSSPDPRGSTPQTGATTQPADSSNADPFADGFVDAHNLARSRVSPAANPGLAELRWNPELAATATAWAKRCKFEHSQTDHGENLSARTEDADPATIVGDWVAEVANYDHRRKRCANGEVCGHYTQVVWRNTSSVGCGVARCDGGGPFGSGVWFMWVCNYDPAGNWQGESPY